MHSQATTSRGAEASERESATPASPSADEAVGSTAISARSPWPLPADPGAMRVGDAHDPAEVEADRSAEQVIDILRRHNAEPDACLEPADTGPELSVSLDRLRRVRRSARMGAQGGPLDPATEGQIERLRGGGSPLPGTVRAPMESALGANLSKVRVHTGGPAASLNDRLGSHAFTVGDDVVFAGGMPDVRRESGQRLWAHELTHVLQQRGDGAVGRLRRKVSETTESESLEPSAGPALTVRRITGLAAFQTATPGSTRHPRKSIKTVDARLTDYIGSAGAARDAALQALIAECNTYINAGGHSGGRGATVTALRTEAQAELPLVQALGANADLLEDIVRRAGGAASLVALTQLVNHLTPAHVNLLPRLIDDAGGAGGLAALDALVQAVNPMGQVMHLPALIGMSAGHLNHLAPLLAAAQANVADLVFLIPKAGGGNQLTLNTLTGLLGVAVGGSALTSYGGHTEKLTALATLANGNQGTFVRLAGEARHFTQTAVPAQPGGLTMNLPRVAFDGTLPGPDPGGPYTNARYTLRWGHYFDRHVRQYFDFGQIKDINAFWPAAWTNPNMQGLVNAWLGQAAAAGIYMGGPTALTDRRAPTNYRATVVMPLGANVQVQGGVFNQPAGVGFPAVDQFFPLRASVMGQAAAGIVDFSANELRAIQAAVT